VAALPAVREAFVRFWGRMGPLWGIPPATGQVHAYLLSRSEPPDAEEIATALAMSRGSVSMALKELVDWGLVHAGRPAGSRRTLHRAEDDVERVLRAVLETRKRREWNPLREHLGGWIEDLRRETSRDATALRERLQRIEGIVALLDELAESFLRGGSLGSKGLRAFVSAALRRAERGVRRRHGAP
jgi:DNA-binding transcriptional regulator GbsR (MarR family)